MGCIHSSGMDKQRRRLSVLKGGEVPSGENGERGPTSKVETLLELLPLGPRRFSLVGQQCPGTQKGFENKNIAIATQHIDTTLQCGEFGIGYACKKGLKPESPNQDDFFAMKVDAVCGLYGVFDGHGPYGHEISHFAHQLLPAILLRSELFKTDPSEALRRSFLKTQQQCVKAQDRGKFDCSLSGSTATVVLVKEEERCLYVSHVGDSRAILGVSNEQNKMVALEIATDHKPSVAKEKKRIEASGGQVRCLNGDINDRVFLKHKLYPGLAMSRSLGDLVGASAGVSSEPDVNRIDLSPEHKILILCSDGVWEFISNQEALDLVLANASKGFMAAAEALAQEAWARWIKEEGNVVDDITVIVVDLTRVPVQSGSKRSVKSIENGTTGSNGGGANGAGADGAGEA